MYTCKKAVFGQSDCIPTKIVEFLQTGCTWAQVVVFGQKWLYSCKSGFIRAKTVVFGQKVLYSGKWLYFSKGGCIGAKMDVFMQNRCIWTK